MERKKMYRNDYPAPVRAIAWALALLLRTSDHGLDIFLGKRRFPRHDNLALTMEVFFGAPSRRQKVVSDLAGFGFTVSAQPDTFPNELTTVIARILEPSEVMERVVVEFRRRREEDSQNYRITRDIAWYVIAGRPLTYDTAGMPRLVAEYGMSASTLLRRRRAFLLEIAEAVVLGNAD